ncbi:hypothetical protein [Nostoc sp. PA-18-2419]|uniref:hypothetical protein n=1 Tax=Nostoc sp. PA-18-2419 TaxID=2575443 RepID=UPI0011085246|nr:hypothetical protein [Nostoc sp. PA-18-2419]
MQKTTILTLTLVSVAILPVAAQYSTSTSQLGQVWTDFQSYSTDLQNYFQYNLSDNLKPVEVQSQNALNTAKGELNIPDPVTAGKKVRDDLILYSSNSDSKSNRFENNAAVRGNLISNELNRVITRGSVAGVLGENGQIRTKSKLENTEKSLQDIADFAQAADKDSQNWLSQIPIPSFDPTKLDPATAVLAQLLNANQSQSIKIQQEQSKIVAETFAQTLQTNQSLQYSNLNLANISQQTEEANRARRVETSTEAARLLRATSQLDLFGRKVDK